ncbi:MAG: multicopper oxidase domain-containing protein, partial [Actinomycetota bacterium]
AILARGCRAYRDSDAAGGLVLLMLNHVNRRAGWLLPPPVLSRRTEVMGLQPSQSVATRSIRLERKGGLWTVNGNTWATVVDSGYSHVEATGKLHDTEIWELRNNSGGWFHPTHLHLVDFKILTRNGRPPLPYELGPKDTVYLGENEVVRVLLRYEHVGKYMIHCHNLLHEDHDMMSQYEVVAPDAVGDDPLTAAVPKSLDFEPFDLL